MEDVWGAPCHCEKPLRETPFWRAQVPFWRKKSSSTPWHSPAQLVKGNSRCPADVACFSQCCQPNHEGYDDLTGHVEALKGRHDPSKATCLFPEISDDSLRCFIVFVSMYVAQHTQTKDFKTSLVALWLLQAACGCSHMDITWITTCGSLQTRRPDLAPSSAPFPPASSAGRRSADLIRTWANRPVRC